MYLPIHETTPDISIKSKRIVHLQNVSVFGRNKCASYQVSPKTTARRESINIRQGRLVRTKFYPSRSSPQQQKYTYFSTTTKISKHEKAHKKRTTYFQYGAYCLTIK